MTIGIYCYENLINNKKYIGQSNNIEKRIKYHESNFKFENSRDENKPLWKAVKKYGRENFYFYIIEECSLEDLDAREIYNIEKYESHCENWGYNVSFGGASGMKGRFHSEETKIKMSENHWDTSGENNPFYGKTHSQETRERISKNRKGKYTGSDNLNFGRDMSGENHPMFGKKYKNSSSKYHGVTIAVNKDKKYGREYVYWGAFHIKKHISIHKNEIDAAKSYDLYIIENKLFEYPLNFPENYKKEDS